ncbi:hypothetical protein I6E29_04825 [Arcanobacterium haemolyticum]|nr:hypothetical protein [Arcanobacterium haemolyticum]
MTEIIDYPEMTDDEAALVALYRRLNKDMIDRNIDDMADIFDESYTLHRMTGVRQTREQWFADMMNGRMTYDASTEVS